MTYNKNINSHNLENLNKSLANTMLVGGWDASILDKQVEILDRLFAAVVDEQVAQSLTQRSHNNESSKEWLKLALQCQKQCADTIKSRAAIEYMDGLSRTNTPHPIKTIKQTE